VLEIGAGLGSLGALLAERFDYVGLEPDRASYDVALDRVGESGVVLNETAEHFESTDQFDLVCAFEVLEHMEDDRAVLQGWLRHVRPGGCVLVSVPFARERFGPWDRRAGHYRRYDADDIVETMTSVGLGPIETVVYGFPLGRLLEIGRNTVARLDRERDSMRERTARSGRQLQPPDWAATSTRLVSAPFRLAQRPFSRSRYGTGVVALGRV
jgi:SAM-dependent methyltransferase